MSSEKKPYGFTKSALCSLLPRPQIMTGVFKDILSTHFSVAARVEEPSLKHLIWTDSEATKIVIEPITKWKPETTRLIPGIIIKRNAYSNQRAGIADRMDRLTPVGNEKFSTYWQGSHTFFCVGGSGTQAELLSTEVQRYLTEFASVIINHVKLDRLSVVSVGEIAKLEESDENFVVPVVCAYIYQENWEIMPQVPRLNRLTVKPDTILDP